MIFSACNFDVLSARLKNIQILKLFARLRRQNCTKSSYELSVKTDNSENTDKKIRDASNIDFAGDYDHLQTKNHSFKYISKEEAEVEKNDLK